MLSGTWKMPVPWFLLSLALGRSPVVVSLERLMEPQDTAHCSLVSLGLWEAGKGSEFRLCLFTALVCLLSLPSVRTALSGLSGADGGREEGKGTRISFVLWEELRIGSPRSQTEDKGCQARKDA